MSTAHVIYEYRFDSPETSCRPESPPVMAKTGAQRVKDTEDRKRAAGLVRVCIWAHPDDSAPLRELAAKLAKRRERQKVKA